MMTKQLESLTIHRFRGLRDLQFSELGRINLLVGPNNSGKTSVLEALSIYSRPLSVLQWVQTAKTRGFIPLFPPRLMARLGSLDEIKWLFPQFQQHNENEEHRGSVRVSGTGSFVISEMRARFEEFVGSWEPDLPTPESESAEAEDIDGQVEIFRRGADLFVEIGAEAGPNQLELIPSGEISNRAGKAHYRIWENRSILDRRPRSGPQLKMASITPFTHRAEPIPIKLLSDAEVGGYTDDAIRLVKEIDPDVLDLEILSSKGTRPEFHIRHAKLGLAPLSVFGDGMRRVLVMALILPSVTGGMLLIDEIESSIHVSALHVAFGWLSRACRQYDVQVFATTHSLEAIDAIIKRSPGDLEDVVGYLLYQDETKRRTVAKRYGGDMLRRMRFERGLDIRTL